MEIDLKGAKTINISSYLTTLGISDALTGIYADGNALTIDGVTVTGLVGSEKCTLLFKTESYDLEATAKIYTLKIHNAQELYNMGATLNNNKVDNGKGGYVSGGYYVLMNDITVAAGKTQQDHSPGLYITLTDGDSGFNGVFDGQGYKIEGLRVYSPRTGSGANAGLNARGLFSNLTTGGVVKNVSITAGTVDATNTIFGYNSKGSLENVRIHIEKAIYNGSQAPLFDNAILGGSLKNVFVTYGSSVTFAGNSNGLISSIIESGVTIEGLYVVGGYTSTSNTNPMITWTKNKGTHDARYIAAMTKGGVKYGAYFASATDFASGVETIEHVAQAATDVYKNQIASLFDSAIWDLSGTLPELKKLAE